MTVKALHYTSIGLLLAVALAPQVHACTDRNEPLASPLEGVRLKLLHEKGSDRPPGELSRVKVNKEQNNGKDGAELYWSDAEESFTPLGGSVRYEEPDGKGGWRTCREEVWQSRVLRNSRGEGRNLRYLSREVQPAAGEDYVPAPVLYPGKAAQQERNPVLAGMTKHFFVRFVQAYYYDEQGRLVEAANYESDEVNNNPIINHPSRIYPDHILKCIRYHGDTLRVAASARPSGEPGAEGTESCAVVDRAHWYINEYNTLPNGAEWELSISPTQPIKEDDHPDDQRRKRLDGPWIASGLVTFAGTPDGSRNGRSARFVVNSHGLTSIRTQWRGFEAEDRTPLFTDQVFGTEGLDIIYHFPHETVPLDVAMNGLEGIARYRRVRATHSSGLASYIAEEFPADSHQPARRMWSSMSGIYRDEFFDAAGRPMRVVNRGLFNQDGGYPENLRAYAESGVLKVTPASIFEYGFRVYEYGPDGTEQLALVCWEFDRETQRPYMPFPWWTGEQPRQFADRMERMKYYRYNVAKRCGPPDGRSVVVESDGMEQYMRDTYDFGSMKHGYENEDDESTVD